MPSVKLPNGSLRDEIRMPLFNEGVSFVKENIMHIEQAQNGFIVTIHGEKYIFTSLWRLKNFIDFNFAKPRKKKK